MIMTLESCSFPIADTIALRAESVASIDTSIISVGAIIGRATPLLSHSLMTVPFIGVISTFQSHPLIRQSNTLERCLKGVEGVREGSVLRIDLQNRIHALDTLAVENALSIKLVHCGENHSLGLTMRTPGDDIDLIFGMLYSEGIIESNLDVHSLSIDSDEAKVILEDSCKFDASEHRRRTTKSSACGVCGKESISNLLHTHGPKLRDNFSLDITSISQAAESLISSQRIFELTGGTHAAAFFSEDCELISLREDIGRHNALDKLIGSYIRQPIYSTPPLLFVSGRASFELVQKCIRFGIPIMASVGAASTLAVDMAIEHNLTLLSFVRDGRMVVHSTPHRISNY